MAKPTQHSMPGPQGEFSLAQSKERQSTDNSLFSNRHMFSHWFLLYLITGPETSTFFLGVGIILKHSLTLRFTLGGAYIQVCIDMSRHCMKSDNIPLLKEFMVQGGKLFLFQSDEMKGGPR